MSRVECNIFHLFLFIALDVLHSTNNVFLNILCMPKLLLFSPDAKQKIKHVWHITLWTSLNVNLPEDFGTWDSSDRAVNVQ